MARIVFELPAKFSFATELQVSGLFTPISHDALRNKKVMR